MSLRPLELGPRGHAERLDGGDERTGGRLFVDDRGAVHWRPYDEAPDARYATVEELQAENVEPGMAPQTPADEAARLKALADAEPRP